MRTSLSLALLLALSPARAAEIRVDAAEAAASGAPRAVVAPVTPLSAGLVAAPSLTAAPSATVPLSAPLAAPAPLAEAAAAPAAAAAGPSAPALALVPAASLPSQTPSARPAAPAAADEAPSGALARVRAVLARARTWLLPPSTIPGPDSNRDAAYYHGTSLTRLEAAAADGAKLSAVKTYVSNEAGYPHGYARSAARKDGTHGVVLEFSKPAVEGKLVQGHFSPVHAPDRGKPTQLAQFKMAVVDLPLSALTPASKAAVLAHYALARDRAPGDAAAEAKLEAMAKALGEPVPARRPLADVRALAPGERIVLADGREALLGGFVKEKAVLVLGRDGAWLDKKTVPLSSLTRVLDAGRASEATRAAVGALHELDWSAGTPAEVLDRRFAAKDFWGAVAPDARAEILGLRARKLSKAEMKAYVREAADAALARVRAARGTADVGFHFNLHGGTREGYLGSGIRAAKGDIALRYSTQGDLNDKVYFFHTEHASAFDALDASNGEILFLPSRMGSVLNVFAVDHPVLEAAKADGRITDVGAISMDFHKGMRGVPYAAYLAPPMQVFVGTAKKLGLRKLSRDEETLATVRYLEAALLGGEFVPGGPQGASQEAAAEAAAARRRAATLAAPLDQVPYSFKLKNNDYLYHGTTLDDLAATVASGGEMRPDVSMYSVRAEDSIGYASERQRRLGRGDNPRVLLQFRYDDLRALTSAEPFRAAVMAADRMPPIHAAYVAASKPVPLSLMTPASKESLLAFLRAQAEARPGEPKWKDLLAQFEKALAR